MSKALDRVSKLINQADRAATPGERDAFMEKAQEMASAAGIDLAVARAHQADKEKREEPESRKFQVGSYTADVRASQVSKWLTELFIQLASINDVRLTVSQDRVWCFSYGFPSDLDVLDALFRVLAVQMVADADAALKRGEHRELRRVVKLERVPLPEEEWWWFRDRYVKHEMRPVRDEHGNLVYEERLAPVADGRVWRANFYEGWIRRMAGRLYQAKRDALKSRQVDMDADDNPTAVVLRDKQQEVEDFFHKETGGRFVRDSSSEVDGPEGGGSKKEPKYYEGASTSDYVPGARKAGGDAAARARLDEGRDLAASKRPALEG